MVIAPQPILVDTQVIQVIPRKNAAFVAIREHWFDGVIANGLQLNHANVTFAGLQHFLARAVALHLC